MYKQTNQTRTIKYKENKKKSKHECLGLKLLLFLLRFPAVFLLYSTFALFVSFNYQISSQTNEQKKLKKVRKIVAETALKT